MSENKYRRRIEIIDVIMYFKLKLQKKHNMAVKQCCQIFECPIPVLIILIATEYLYHSLRVPTNLKVSWATIERIGRGRGLIRRVHHVLNSIDFSQQ